ncbi:uncharacterized protein LOC125945021 [Dermacentor silvarum]|uniref:uncharacterized protein LOC125945021 n=1 Tax=Dermacentor silvarum TaxID=543639 RepID=UPI00210145F1|nr:uncharacterized protein LOC125945021 [Dermacentor silvarum]
MRLITLICVLQFAASSFDYRGRASLEDVKSFFGNSHNIVMLHRSYNRNISGDQPVCIYYKSSSVQGDIIRTTQSFVYGSYMDVISIRIKISKGQFLDDAPVLEATANRGDLKKRIYHFQYYDDGDKCAVITFNDGPGTTKCELYVWLSHVLAYNDYGNCKTEYDYMCGERKQYEVYNASCVYNN